MKKLTKFLFTLALIASFVTLSSCSKKENYSLLTEEDFSSQWLNGKWQFSVIAKDNLSGRTETFSKEIIEFNTENQTATLPEYKDTSDELSSTIAEFFKEGEDSLNTMPEAEEIPDLKITRDEGFLVSSDKKTIKFEYTVKSESLELDVTTNVNITKLEE